MARKRLIVCCDGTWNWPDQDGSPTNVVKMVRAIRATAKDGTPQVVSYDVGVGTGNILDRLAGGTLGVGLADNVKAAYGFLVDNYQPPADGQSGDQIFLFGFSRGAYTVRSLAGLIGLVGLLQKETMDYFQKSAMEGFPSAWDYYRTPPPERTPAQRQKFLDAFGPFPPYPVNVHMIGVWDTVGALGIPFGPFRYIGRQRYHFHNTNLGDNVAHAYQALAIDEQRKSFEPAIWKQEPAAVARAREKGIERQVLEQVWFTGVHSNVGGGYADTGLSDLAFLWMADKAKDCGLELDHDFIAREQAKTEYRLVDSRTAKWKFQGRLIRALCSTDPSERVHKSVVERCDAAFARPFAPTPYAPGNLLSLKSRADFETLLVDSTRPRG